MQPTHLAESGIDVILVHAMFAVVGAVALEKGGLVANQVVRDRILKPLGSGIGM
jgi:large subunit ribosomal protein L15